MAAFTSTQLETAASHRSPEWREKREADGREEERKLEAQTKCWSGRHRKLRQSADLADTGSSEKVPTWQTQEAQTKCWSGRLPKPKDVCSTINIKNIANSTTADDTAPLSVKQYVTIPCASGKLLLKFRTCSSFKVEHRAFRVRNISQQVLPIIFGTVARSVSLPTPQCCWCQPTGSQLAFLKLLAPFWTDTSAPLPNCSSLIHGFGTPLWTSTATGTELVTARLRLNRPVPLKWTVVWLESFFTRFPSSVSKLGRWWCGGGV